MESILHTIKAKGLTTTIRKLMLNFKRYHFGTKKTMNRFELIADIMSEYDAKMTIHVPAVLLEHYPQNFKKINDKNIEWGLHGYKHIDHSKLDYQECYTQLKTAQEIFTKNGITAKGFRAPYLRGSKNVLKALSNLGLKYDSSGSVYVDVVDKNDPKIKTILDFYNPDDSWRMEKKFEVLQLPVLLPDDEMLVDRLGQQAETIGKTWLKVAKTCLRNNWLFILQLHPDRVEPCSIGLKMVLDWALDNNIWLPALSEIVDAGGLKEGYKGAIAVTGDLDLITIWDYYRIS